MSKLEPKTLTLDIETMAQVAFVWGFYEQNVIEVIDPWYVLMVGYKWLHEKKAHVLSLHDYKGFKKNPRDHTALIKDVWKLMDEADIIVTQNGDNFDIKKLNTCFIKAGLPPYSPFKSVDTKKQSKAHFNFINNKLDVVGKELGIGGKKQHEGFDMWKKCWNGDVKAFKTMKAYCLRDIIVTEAVYLKERPWMKNHPNSNAFTERDDCPKCGSSDIQYRGEEARKTGKIARFFCKNCTSYSYGKQRTVTTIR